MVNEASRKENETLDSASQRHPPSVTSAVDATMAEDVCKKQLIKWICEEASQDDSKDCYDMMKND